MIAVGLDIAGIDLVMSGHTVLAKARPVAVSNLLFIDTGAFMPQGRLTLVEPLTGQYWQTGFVGGNVRALRRSPTSLPQPFELREPWRPTQAMRDEARSARKTELDLLKRLWP